jgi:methionyl aminopeptidase
MDYDYEGLKEVGKVSFEALQYAKGLVKVGASTLGVAEKVDDFISAKGMQFAFPLNLSVNERAAHFTPVKGDPAVFTEGDVVKIDLGARRNDACGDCALTVDLSGKHGKLVEATDAALEAALSTVRAGRQLKDIGKAVEMLAKAKGLNPIRNLGGHGIEEGELHASIFIPNYDNGDATELEEGQVVAIEIFLTEGSGYVVDGEELQIFRKLGDAPARSEDTRKVASFIDANYGTYPFALRWLYKKFDSEFMVRRALNELSSLGALDSFPGLVEKTGGIVAQAEREVVVGKDSYELVTK